MSLPKAPLRSRQSVLSPGQILAGSYQVISEIDQGGMGVVYEVLHQGLGRRQALKVIQLTHLSRKMISRFLNEARTLARFSHPNIVRVYDIGVAQNSIGYFAMELLHGVTLEEHLSSHGALDEDEALRLFGQLLDALFYAHARGVVHRDIKPANIMLVRDDGGRLTVKVFDFGVARYFDDLGDSIAVTTTGDVVGSPSHMSPEQALGKRVDLRTDIYSAGCVLFEMLTGKQLFKGDNALLTIGKHIGEDPLARLNLEFNDKPELVSFLLLCLAKSPEDRFADVHEARLALGTLVSRKVEQQNRHYLAVLKERASRMRTLPQPAILLMFFVALCMVSFSVIWLAIDMPLRRLDKPRQLPSLPAPETLAIGYGMPLSQSEITSNDLRLKQFAAYASVDAKFSTIEQAGEKQFRVFRFLPNVPLGALKLPDETVQAVGQVTVPANLSVVLSAGSGVAVYPQILRRFRDDDLRGLHFANNHEVRSEAFKYATHLKRLENINVRNSFVDNEIFDYLNQMPAVRSVDFTASNVDGHGLLRWKYLKNAKTLRIGFINDVAPVLGQLQICRDLELLNIDGTCIKAADIAKIAKLKKLYALTVTCDKIKPGDLLVLKELKNLHRLTLNGQDFGPEFVAVLEQLKALRNLSISAKDWSESDRARLFKNSPQYSLELVSRYNFEYSFKGDP